MSDLPPKTHLKDELVRALAADLATLERAHEATRAGATHEEAKPENDKDTRALEQSYLARGQAMRIEELRAGLADVASLPLRPLAAGAPIALGALVEAEEEGAPLVLFVAPHGGGTKLAGGRVQVVTPRSPLGRALLGKTDGDSCELQLEGRTREIVILRAT